MAFGGRSSLKMSEETFDFVCTSCARGNKTVEAVKYCLECGGYCCQSCTDVHKLFPALIGHNLTDVSQANQVTSQKTSLTEFPTERCSIHKSKVVDMYCEHHDVVGCYVCIAKDHKSCQDDVIHSVPDMIDTLFKLSDSEQTHSLLKDMMASLKIRSKSKDSQLQALSKAQKETLDKVQVFHKALEAILRKVVEASIDEVKAAYKELEMEVLQEKQTLDSVCEDLITTDEKLQQTEGNRAQRFVCSKIAQDKMKDADHEMKKKLQSFADTQVIFIPNQSLMEFMKALQSIGQVERKGKQKNDLYAIKICRDITMKLPKDSNGCSSHGCCLTSDEQLLVTDWKNKKLKRVDLQKMSVVDYCTLDAEPYGVCCVSEHEVAVACDHMIQFVSIDNKMIPSKKIKFSHDCYGIAFNNDKLYVTCRSKFLHVYDITGTLLKRIVYDNAGRKLFSKSVHVTFDESGNKMFVGDMDMGLVCFDGMGNYLSTIKDPELKSVRDVCVDGRGNMFVMARNSHNVLQFSEDGEKLGEVLKKADGLHDPISMCFSKRLNTMFVTMLNSDVLKSYELK